MNKPIDIFIATYLRQFYTEKTISYLKERTNYPYRLIVLDNGGNDEVLSKADDVMFLWVKMNHNTGIHCLWNVALSLAESEYFITSDNDIWVPKLDPDWLTQMVRIMDNHPDYGAISLHPHVFIGINAIDPNSEDFKKDVIERPMVGAVMRLMRTEAVRKTLGWEHVIRTGRNHEERVICSRLQSVGYKVGICPYIRAYHPFGRNYPGLEGEKSGGWGYPVEFGPEKQGHRPELKEYVVSFDKIEAYNQDTWLPL